MSRAHIGPPEEEGEEGKGDIPKPFARHSLSRLCMTSGAENFELFKRRVTPSAYIFLPFETRREKKLHWPQTCQNAPLNTYIRCGAQENGKFRICGGGGGNVTNGMTSFPTFSFPPPPFFCTEYRAYFTFRELKAWGKEGGKCIAKGEGGKKSPDSFSPPACFMEFSTVFFVRNGTPFTKRVNLFFPPQFPSPHRVLSTPLFLARFSPLGC